MKYYRYETRKKEVTLYPLVCMHVGAKQSDTEFIQEHVQRIADDPNGLWIYLGDGGECVTRASKGELYEQHLSPDEQIDRLVELMEPIRGKGLFGVSGNHDRRIAKLSGIDWTHALCARLSIPYLGLAAFMRLVFVLSNRPKHRGTCMRGYDLFWHHGADSSSLLGGKINAARKLEQLVWADDIFSAHSHICTELPPSYTAFLENRAGEIKYKETRNFVCGCAYDSRVPGYAMEKAYTPILPAYLGVTYSMQKRGSGNDSEWYCKKDCQIWRKQV